MEGFILEQIEKNGHGDGLGFNFNQLGVTFLFLCLKWLLGGAPTS